MKSKIGRQKIKKEPNNFLKKLNLENIKSGSQNPSDGYFEFILPNGETTL